MGMDVQLYALVEVTKDELDVANAFFSPRCPRAMINEYRDTTKCLEYEGPRDYYDYIMPETPQWPRVELRTLQRYADCFKTWPWPPIHQAIRLLQATFPDAVICYGSDSLDWCAPITEKAIENMWAAWYKDKENENITDT